MYKNKFHIKNDELTDEIDDILIKERCKEDGIN